MALRGSFPRKFKLSLRSQPERGGPVRATVKDEDGLAGSTDWRHLLLLVHGFNNAESEAKEKFRKYVDMIQPALEKSRVAPDGVAKLHWPGNEAFGPFAALDFMNYPVDVKRALESVQPLAEFLTRLIQARTDGRLISIVGHSLGCRLILEAMLRIAAAGATGPPFSVVCLMAGASPVALAEAGQPLARARDAANKLLVAHSRDDLVLSLAFPLGQFGAWLGGYEAASYGEAIGRFGNPVGFGDSVPRDGIGHGSYWTDEACAKRVLEAMDATLRTLPDARERASRELAPVGQLPTRGLAARELPD